MQARTVSAGWYTDPENPRDERYFDGRKWTHHVRKDIPDIPLAPWVDPRTVPAVNGHAVDTSAPRSNLVTWISLGLATVGVAVAFVVGYLQTTEGIRAAAGVPGGYTVEDPPAGVAGAALHPTYTCADIMEAVLEFDRDDNKVGIVTWAGSPAVTFDNQPIRTLPNDSATVYRMLGCTVDAATASGQTVSVVTGLYTNHQGQLIVAYDPG
ncbi:MAG: DUF2510 domain-containing protein [bacterium]|nr:DUF2510 domain-containing protein [bacterium]